ncbi:hypothetical protein NLO95_08525 [Pseudomonas syringae]|nr:hypothetical protein [Pseudomonas syringae]
MDLLSDLKFWALVISLISLAFSILPTIRNWWKGKNLAIEAQGGVMLSHKWGYTNINWTLTFINTGGTPLRIKNINIVVKKEGGIPVTIPVQTFFRTFDAKVPTLYSALVLKPNEETTHTFCFYHKPPRFEEKAISEITSAARRELSAPVIGPGPLVGDMLRPTLSADTLNRLEAIFKEKFYLTCGEYELGVNALDEHGNTLATRKFRFTLFESDESDLRNIVKNYPSGDGITFSSEVQVWFYTSLTDI